MLQPALLLHLQLNRTARSAVRKIAPHASKAGRKTVALGNAAIARANARRGKFAANIVRTGKRAAERNLAIRNLEIRKRAALKAARPLNVNGLARAKLYALRAAATNRVAALAIIKRAVLKA